MFRHYVSYPRDSSIDYVKKNFAFFFDQSLEFDWLIGQ